MRRIAGKHRYAFVLATALAGACLPNSFAWAATYEYDALGRITKVTYDDGSYVVYAYDANGNRTVVTAVKS